jgi:putative FmdB family regulatory protein
MTIPAFADFGFRRQVTARKGGSMPTYAYVCDNCEHELEVVQSFSEDALVKCPECAEDQLRRRIFAAGIIFKGEGWYVTDNRSKKEKSEAKKDNGEGGESKKSESKSIEASSGDGKGEKTESKAKSNGVETSSK